MSELSSWFTKGSAHRSTVHGVCRDYCPHFTTGFPEAQFLGSDLLTMLIATQLASSRTGIRARASQLYNIADIHIVLSDLPFARHALNHVITTSLGSGRANRMKRLYCISQAHKHLLNTYYVPRHCTQS